MWMKWFDRVLPISAGGVVRGMRCTADSKMAFIEECPPDGQRFPTARLRADLYSINARLLECGLHTKYTNMREFYECPHSHTLNISI